MSTLPTVPHPTLSKPESQRTLRRVVASLPTLSFIAAAVLFAVPPASAQIPQQLSQQTANIDPPGRVARMNLAEGPVSYAPADPGEPRWTAAVLNRPLTTGDRLWTGQRARSELHIGSTAVRLGEQTSLDFVELDDDTTQLRLAQGTMKLRVRNLFDGQRIEINTPNLAFVITQPGDYRIEANPAGNVGTGTTRVVVQQGAGSIYGDGGAQLNIASGQQANFTDTQLTPAGPGPDVQDGFDAWALQRDRLEDQSVSARYVPREVVGYQQLDSYGDWNQDPTYGAVWLPRAVPVNWAPYRDGHWSWIAPWGWTWVDDAPWGFAPFHYGRWAQIGPRWGWVPGRIAPRPVYAPALVAFIGGNAGGVNWNVSIGQQGPRPGLGWFPLAPGEAFRPAYRHSPRYVTNVNHNIVVNNVNVTNNYRYQREGRAVSVMSAEDFARGQRVRPEGQRLNPADLGRAQLIAPERGGLPQHLANGRDLPRVASPAALPPAAIAARPVVTSQFPQPGQRDERRNERREDRRDRPGEGVGQMSRPGLPVQPGQPVIVPPGAAPDRGLFDAEQRARAEQHRQQQERAGSQRPPGEESLGQRALREQAQRNGNINSNMNSNPNLAMPPAQPGRPDAGRDPIEQAQREQQRLQRDQQRQQMDTARQQEQQRRQADESIGQRAMQEQAQRQQQAQRQIQEQQAQQAQQAQQTQQRAQQEQARQQQAAQQQQLQRAQQDQQRQAQQQQQQQQQVQQQQRQQQDQARQQQAAEHQAQQAQQAQQRAQQDQVRQQQAQQRAQQDQARQQQAAQQQPMQQQQRQAPEQPRAAGRERPPRPGEAVSGAPPEDRFNRRRE